MTLATLPERTNIGEIRNVMIDADMPVELRKKKVVAVVGHSIEFGNLPKESVEADAEGKDQYFYKQGDRVEGFVNADIYSNKGEVFSVKYPFSIDMTYVLTKPYANTASLRRAGKRELEKLIEEFKAENVIFNNLHRVVDIHAKGVKYIYTTSDESTKDLLKQLYGNAYTVG